MQSGSLRNPVLKVQATIMKNFLTTLTIAILTATASFATTTPEIELISSGGVFQSSFF